jgi:hypothetical protein
MIQATRHYRAGTILALMLVGFVGAAPGQVKTPVDTAALGRPLWGVGVNAAVQRHGYDVGFSSLSGAPNCCGGFPDGGNGMGFSGGIVGRYWPWERMKGLSFSASFDIAYTGGSLVASDKIGYALDSKGEVVIAESEYHLEPSMVTGALVSAVRFRPLKFLGLMLNAGIGIGTALSTSYDEYEQVVASQGVQYTDGDVSNRSRRNVRSGTIASISGLFADARIGVGYDIIIPGIRTGGMSLMLSPEVWLTRNLNSLHENSTWDMQAIRLGVTASLVRQEPVGYIVPGAFRIIYDLRDTYGEAEAVMGRLEQNGIGGLMIEQITVSGRTVYQIQSGNYESLRDANVAIEEQESNWDGVIEGRPVVQEVPE